MGGEPLSRDGTIDYEFKFSKKEDLSPREFLLRFLNHTKDKKVVSVGEYHDENKDNSFEWIEQFKDEILDGLVKYVAIQSAISSPPEPEILLKQCLPPESKLFDYLSSFKTSFDQLRKMHPGRLFAVNLLPLAKVNGFTDIVFEGLNVSNPGEIIERSKDKRGDLLRILFSMSLGFRIHGAEYFGRALPSDVSDSLFRSIESSLTMHPEAKVIVYNGAIHNMTEPIQGSVDTLIGNVDSSKMTYAPRAIERWGEQYASLDIVRRGVDLAGSHLQKMAEISRPDQITCFTHGKNQLSFVID